MANIVGLGSTQDPAAAGGRRLRDADKLADGLDVVKPVELRPTAQPVDTYARPAQAPVNHDLQNLVEGLSSLNHGLNHYARVLDRDSKKNAKEVDKDQIAIAFAGKSPEEVDQIIKTNPLFQKAVNAQYGGELQARKQGDADTSWWVDHLNNGFDFQNGDFNKQFDEYVAKRTTQFGPNKGYASSYMEQMAGSKVSLMQTVLKKRAEIAQYDQQQTTQDGMASIIRQSVNTGESQESLVNTVSNFVRNNKDIARLPYKEQQQYILNGLTPLLQDMDQRPEQRDKIYDAVNTVLTAPRKGEDGVERRLIDAPQGMGEAYKGKLAEFAKKRDDLNDRYLTDQKAQFSFNAEHDPQTFTDKELDDWNAQHNFTYTPAQVQALKLKRAESLKALADKALLDQAKEKADGAKANVTSQNLQSLENGDFLFPKDKDVPTPKFFTDHDERAVEKFTGDAQRQAAIDAYGKKLDDQENRLVNSKKMTPDQAKQWRMGQELATYSLNGIVPKAWKEEISVGANQLTTVTQTGKEMPQAAVQAFERYKLIASKAPNLLDQVADERTKMIYGTAMQIDGDPVDQLRGAVHYYSNRDEKREQVTMKQIGEVVSGMKPGVMSRIASKVFSGSEAPENLSMLNDKISKRAAYLVQAYHFEPEDAVEKAAKSLRTSYAVINGWAVDTNDKRLPPNFEPLAEKYIKNVADFLGPARFGAQSSKDLTLAPMADGTFQIINKRHGYQSEGPAYMEGPDGEQFDARFLTPDMMQWLQNQQRQKAEIRGVRAGEGARERADIAAREAQALKPFTDASKRNPFKPFILNKNSPQ